MRIKIDGFHHRSEWAPDVEALIKVLLGLLMGKISNQKAACRSKEEEGAV